MAEGAPSSYQGREVGRANPGTAAYLRLHCKTPVAGAPGSSCRRRSGAAAWSAAGGRAPAEGCGPRRPWRAGGLCPAAVARAGGPGTPLLTWPAPPRKLSVLFVKGGSGEGRARGSAPGGEERGLGAASERSPARLLRCLLWLCLLRARAEPPFYCAPRILCSSSRWLAASAGRALPAALLPRRPRSPALPRTPAFVVPSLPMLRASRTTWHAAPQGHARGVPDCALGPHPRSSAPPDGQLCCVLCLMGPDSGWNSGLVHEGHQAVSHPQDLRPNFFLQLVSKVFMFLSTG